MDTKTMLRALSEPHEPGEKIEPIITRTALAAGLSYSRCYEIYYGRARRIDPAETMRISEALDRKNAKDVRNELQELRVRLARLESRLVQTDPEFHRADLGALGEILRPAGAGVRRSR